MKKFLETLLKFLFFFILLISLLQWVISSRIHDKSVRGLDNLRQTENINADLLFLGSSRCTAHFDPQFFDTCFHLKSINLGIDGHGEISMAVLRLNLYLVHNKPPKFLILEFDPTVSAGSETNNRMYIHKPAFARYAFFPDKDDLPILDYFGFNFFERYAPLYSILKYQLFIDCIQSKKNLYPIYSYAKHDAPDYKKYYVGMEWVINTYTMPKDMDSTAIALSRLNDLCAKNGTKLICIQTPVYKAIFDEKAFACPKSICEKLKIPFIDANIPAIRNEKSYFFNADHMNIDGVLMMNRFLKADTLLKSYLGSPR